MCMQQKSISFTIEIFNFSYTWVPSLSPLIMYIQIVYNLNKQKPEAQEACGLRRAPPLLAAGTSSSAVLCAPSAW